jgi:multidrug efflux pump subunit AcrA (membrane-fusion protein)
VLVPPGALYQARAGEGFVFVIDEKNVARLRKLQLGETDDRGTQILAGLRPGERVAISSLDLLRDGQRVTPQERRP